MKNLMIASGAMLLAVAGCQSTGEGALTGAVLGAAGGAIAGEVFAGSPGNGAAYGALVGAALGARCLTTPSEDTRKVVKFVIPALVISRSACCHSALYAPLLRTHPTHVEPPEVLRRPRRGP